MLVNKQKMVEKNDNLILSFISFLKCLPSLQIVLALPAQAFVCRHVRKEALLNMPELAPTENAN